MHELSERTKKVLFAVVQSYINYPDPVGSRAITKRYGFGWSPATIRNIMADLEEMGFLRQPHTSAGRIPTDLGYRFYVDYLTAEPEYYQEKEIFKDIYMKLETLKNDIEMLLGETTRSFSMLSHYLGIAMLPVIDMTTLKRINIIKYKNDNAVVVLLTDEGVIKNKIVKIDPKITQKDLNRMASYINTEFSGYAMDEIRLKILREMSKEKIKCDTLIARAMSLCQEVLCFQEGALFVSGLTEVLNLPDFADLEKIKELSKAIEDKHTIIKLLDKLSESDGVKVIIGSENSLDEMKKLSLIVSPCKESNRPVGIVGIIGPTRMNYAKAIYLVDNTAKFISKMLSGR